MQTLVLWQPIPYSPISFFFFVRCIKAQKCFVHCWNFGTWSVYSFDILFDIILKAQLLKKIGIGHKQPPEVFYNKWCSCNFIKKETLAQVFCCEFCEIAKNNSFTEHLRTTAPDWSHHWHRHHYQHRHSNINTVFDKIYRNSS